MNNLIDINKAKEVFKSGARLTPISERTARKSPPYQIRWEGQIVKLGNGKNIWPTLGAAKCALRQKINENKLIELACLDEARYPISSKVYGCNYYSLSGRDEFYNMVLDELQKQGILVFEPVYPESP